MRNEDSLATILLAGRLAGGGLEPLDASEYWTLCDRVGKPSALLGEGEGELRRHHGVGGGMAGRVAALLDRATSIAFELERLGQSGIATLTPFDEHYPKRFLERMADRAPPVLHAAGRLDLLDRAGLGIVGSPTADREGAGVAEGAAQVAVRRGLPLVSGGARGFDRVAMGAAVGAGGTSIGLLAESLTATLRTTEVRRAIHRDQVVLCTPCGPDAQCSASGAMGRDTLVHAQSLVTLVLASDVRRGDAWAGATEALEHGHGRVAVWRGPGEGPGNAVLVERGATSVLSLDQLDAVLDGVLDGVLDEPERERVGTDAEQISLFSAVEADEPGAHGPGRRSEEGEA